MKVRKSVRSEPLTWRFIYSILLYLVFLCSVIAIDADPLDNWTVRQQIASTARIAYGNGRFVVFPSDYVTFQVLVSTNGTDWNQYLAPDFTTLSDLTFGNGQFIAVYSRQNLPGTT